MHEVIICEKPKASERISSALPGRSVKKTYRRVTYYEVEDADKKTTILAAVGHLYSLASAGPRKKKIFDLEWVPLYEKDRTKKYTKNYVDAIKKLSKDADKFIHACDYDIEGTLIGYNALKYGCGPGSLENAVRMKFSTLTDEDLLEAYENPIPLDINQVDSGIARHVLDFLFGVNISKYLTDAVMKSTKRYIQLSAGRVQTPTLSILVEREKEIKEFEPVPYWVIKAFLKDEIIADHKKGKIFNRSDAEEILKECKGKDAKVKKISLRKNKKIPPFPFDLGSLQSEAYSLFKFSPKKTQQIAQNLYVEGYTSYPRTSSQKLPKSIGYDKILKKLTKSAAFKKQISKLEKPYQPREGKKTDEAHPSIHPTGLLPKKLGSDYQKLYELIVYRFISVFGEDAIVETMKTDLTIGKENFSFTRKRTAKLGWQDQYPYRSVENDEFPQVNEGDSLKAEVKDEEKETKPPARYNQASLIRELEKRGLGTKSTRANIISILYDRKYVEGRKIEVNVLGEQLIDTLKKYSQKITSEELTREFETKLEGIMEGKDKKDQIIDEAKVEIASILDDIEDNKRKIGEELFQAYRESMIVGECKCGNKLIMIDSPRGDPFVGCTGYPDCKSTYSLPKGATILKTKCEKCGLPMISFGKKPRQRACLDPKCGKEDHEPSNEVVGECPDCGSDLIKRSGRYGEFIGCTGFPKCRFTRSVEEKGK